MTDRAASPAPEHPEPRAAPGSRQRTFFEPRYGRAIEALVACWVYRNLVFTPAPVAVTRSPDRPSGGVVSDGTVHVEVNVVDFGGAGDPREGVSIQIGDVATPLSFVSAETSAPTSKRSVAPIHSS
jgi:hypothetical protein